MNDKKTDYSAVWIVIGPTLALLVMFCGYAVHSFYNKPQTPTETRFSQNAFELGNLCDARKQNALLKKISSANMSTFVYSYGLLSVGAFENQEFYVHGSYAGPDNIVCLNVDAALTSEIIQAEKMNETLTRAVLETCKNAKDNLMKVYLTSTSHTDLVPSQIRVIAVPTTDTSWTEGNTKHVQYDTIIGTAHECT